MTKWHEEGRAWEDDRGFLDEEQVTRCARAYEDQAPRSPVPTRLLAMNEVFGRGARFGQMFNVPRGERHRNPGDDADRRASGGRVVAPAAGDAPGCHGFGGGRHDAGAGRQQWEPIGDLLRSHGCTAGAADHGARLREVRGWQHVAAASVTGSYTDGDLELILKYLRAIVANNAGR